LCVRVCVCVCVCVKHFSVNKTQDLRHECEVCMLGLHGKACVFVSMCVNNCGARACVCVCVCVCGFEARLKDRMSHIYENIDT